MASSPRARLWRRLLIATGLAVALATTAAWFVLPVKYEAYALLKVSGRKPSILNDGAAPADEFMLFKATQGQLVASNMVANGVLREEKINRLASVQEHSDDPVSWLKGELTVDFPGDAEIMRIAIKTKRPEDSLKIVDKVVNTYLDEIVERDKQLKIGEESKLQTAYERQGLEYEAALKQLSALEEINETKGSEAAQLKKRLALESLDSELATRKRLLERLEDAQLETVLDEARAALPPETHTADPAPVAPVSSTELPASLLQKKREFFEQKLAETEARIEKMTTDIASLETFSAQVAAKQERLESLRSVKNELEFRVDRIRLERLAPERITEIEKAVLTSENGDSLRRNTIFGTAAAGGLVFVALGLMIGRSRS